MFNRIRTIRKRWFIVAATVALLAVGLVSGAAFAANARADYAANALSYGYGETPGKGRHDHRNSSALLARVAEILGIEQATLESAFATAIDERAETRFDARVAQLVTDETLTQEQADAATTWFEERPELSGPIAYRAALTSDSERVDSLLTRLVNKERITQEEADAISSWHDDRPDSLPELARGRHDRHGHHDGDHSDGHADGADDESNGDNA